MIYVLHPELTVGSNAVAGVFYEASLKELERELPVVALKSEAQTRDLELGKNDALIIFNSGQYPSFVQRLLTARAVIFPVAIDTTLRFPGKGASHRQSFDIPDELARRGQTAASVATVAMAFVRVLLAQVQPTVSRCALRLFLSHRRPDGENLARPFQNMLEQRRQQAFRDLSDILVGEDAQEVIYDRLIRSDAVLFLDTPLACESEWIGKELQMALSLNIPIVWICLGADKTGRRLKVRPAEVPHFNFERTEITPDLADSALHKAFVLGREFAAPRVFDSIRRLRDVCSRDGGLQPEDQRSLLFTVKIPRPTERYPQLPRRHLIQFFGRWPDEADQKSFLDEMEKRSPEFDAGLLLAPIGAIPDDKLPKVSDKPCPTVIDSADEYVSNVQKQLSPVVTVSKKRGVILSGAFPEPEAINTEGRKEHQQDTIDAVHAFAQGVFDRYGVVIFGAHPTFVPLIFDLAVRRRPRDFKEAVHLYVSRYFRPDLAQFEKSATVFPIQEETGGEGTEARNRSLTRMRKAMINDSEAVGLIAIGGKARRPGLSIGVDEEVELARAAGLPVFLIGAVQGRSSELTAEFSAAGWKEKLNDLTPEQNEQLRVSLDFGTLANLVLGSLQL
jgi:hypothetical protein